MTKRLFSLPTMCSSLVAVTLLFAPLHSGQAKEQSAHGRNKSGTAVPFTPAVASSESASRPDDVAKQKIMNAPSRPLEDTDLGRMLNRDAAGLQILRMPDGATMIDVGEGFRSVLILHIVAGKSVTSCIVSKRQAQNIFYPVRSKNAADAVRH